MEKVGKIEVIIKGKWGNQEISPDNFDVRYILRLIEDMENILYPGKEKERPIITYNIEEGSVKHVFKTGMQAIIAATAILTEVGKTQNINFLNIKTARAIEDIQKFSKDKNFEVSFKTSISKDQILKITPETVFIRDLNYWVDTEFYFYGILTNAGGKNKPNIHLDTEEFGTLIIKTGKSYLAKQKENLLYKPFGVRAIGKQNVETGEIDTKSLELIDLFEYQPHYDENYLNKLIKKASKHWKGIDADKWLNEIRGNYE